MSLTSPPLVNVNPGDPITSQQWNNIITAINTLYTALNKVNGSLDVTVKDRISGNPLAGAIVSVIPSGDTAGPPRAAVFVGSSINRYRLDQLPPGTYNVIVQADGYHDETVAVTMADDGSSQSPAVSLTATETLVTVPALVGQLLNAAIAALGSDLQLTRLIDSHGTDIPPGAIPAANLQALVLNQVPAAGVLVPKNSGVFLDISAKAEFVERVKVPDIRGLTIDQARAALEGSKLVLGPANNA